LTFPAFSDFAPSSETPGSFVGQAGVDSAPGVFAKYIQENDDQRWRRRGKPMFREL